MAWSGLDGLTTVDAALVWVDPTRVATTFGAGALAEGVADTPQTGDRLSLADGRSSTILGIGQNVPVTAIGPDWQRPLPYRNQIVCSKFTGAGDSGALVVDAKRRPVGMVVAGGRRPEGDEVTVITPIDAILDPALWDQQQLTLLRALPPRAEAPASPPSAPAAGDWAALPRVAELPLHSHGGRVWKVTRDGIALANAIAPLRSPGPTVTCPQIVHLFGPEIIEACRTHGVPPELVIMTIAAEAGIAMAEGFTGPKTFRWEPERDRLQRGPHAGPLRHRPRSRYLLRPRLRSSLLPKLRS